MHYVNDIINIMYNACDSSVLIGNKELLYTIWTIMIIYEIKRPYILLPVSVSLFMEFANVFCRLFLAG